MSDLAAQAPDKGGAVREVSDGEAARTAGDAQYQRGRDEAAAGRCVSIHRLWATGQFGPICLTAFALQNWGCDPVLVPYTSYSAGDCSVSSAITLFLFGPPDWWWGFSRWHSQAYNVYRLLNFLSTFLSALSCVHVRVTLIPYAHIPLPIAGSGSSSSLACTCSFFLFIPPVPAAARGRSRLTCLLSSLSNTCFIVIPEVLVNICITPRDDQLFLLGSECLYLLLRQPVQSYKKVIHLFHRSDNVRVRR